MANETASSCAHEAVVGKDLELGEHAINCSAESLPDVVVWEETIRFMILDEREAVKTLPWSKWPLMRDCVNWPMTRSPTFQSLTPSPTAMTRPAPSEQGTT